MQDLTAQAGPKRSFLVGTLIVAALYATAGYVSPLWLATGRSPVLQIHPMLFALGRVAAPVLLPPFVAITVLWIVLVPSWATGWRRIALGGVVLNSGAFALLTGF